MEVDGDEKEAAVEREDDEDDDIRLAEY